MSLAKGFLLKFTSSFISDYYKKINQYSFKPGIDRVNAKHFNKNLTENCELISRKVKNGTYNFTPYKEVLILKGKNKFPRLLSLPSIRDKIVLLIIKDLLNEHFNELLYIEFVKKKISRVKKEFSEKNYNTFIKIDMQNFYGSLNHEILVEKLSKKARKSEFKKLILEAISNPTICQNENKRDVSIFNQGVPQGLPISNILADIYMIDFDNKHINNKNYSYFRYVDDILILCYKEDSEVIYNNMEKELSDNLKLNPYILDTDQSKTHIGSIDSGLSYLGYYFLKDKVTVRKKSKLKLELAIEGLFNEYKNTNISFNAFLWKVNLRITGGIFNSNTYGWLFYFSQIDDETLMFELDNFIQKMFERYKLNRKLIKSDIELKRFSRTFNEIKYNKKQSKYIPNFDNIKNEEKRTILQTCKLYSKLYDDEENLKYAFQRFISRNMKELEKDRGSIS